MKLHSKLCGGISLISCGLYVWNALFFVSFSCSSWLSFCRGSKVPQSGRAKTTTNYTKRSRRGRKWQTNFVWFVVSVGRRGKPETTNPHEITIILPAAFKHQFTRGTRTKNKTRNNNRGENLTRGSKRFHASPTTLRRAERTRLAQFTHRLKAITALRPPKAKEFEIAASGSAARASLAMTLMLQAGSGSLKFAFGGSRPL